MPLPDPALSSGDVLALLLAGTHNCYSEPVPNAPAGTVRITLCKIPRPYIADVTEQMLDLRNRGLVHFNGLLWLPSDPQPTPPPSI